MYTTLSLLLASPAVAVQGGPVVETSFGRLIGSKAFLHECEQWLGVPFAQPPLGKLRFKDPAPWNESFPAAGRDATSYGAYCPQPSGDGDEDCLFLNVWRPSKTTPDALPIMVWIYGGAYVFGASSSEAPGIIPRQFNMYNGCAMSAKQDVIVASMNYRLGPLGFATFEEDGVRSGNFGVKDQREAFLWLRREAKNFGGDSEKITIFGESAGGMSVFYHVASPKSKGLFRAGISESGFPNADSWEFRQSITKQWAARVNCSKPAEMQACLRGKQPKDLIKAAGEVANPFTIAGWGPVIDGSDMPEHPAKIFHEGRGSEVPLLAGTNTDEGNLFVWPVFEGGMNETQYRSFVVGMINNHDPIQKLSPAELERVFKVYNETGSKDKRKEAAAIARDMAFLCGTHFAADGHAKQAPTYLYRFNHRPACQGFSKFAVPGVYHGAEIMYVFGSPLTTASCIWTPSESSLSDRMQKMWANFAKNLNPSIAKEHFPQYVADTRLTRVLQAPDDDIESDYRADYCKLWRNVTYGKLVNQSKRRPSALPTIVV